MYTVVAQFQSGHVASVGSDSVLGAVKSASELHAAGFTDGVSVYADEAEGPVMIASYGTPVPHQEPNMSESRPNPAPLVSDKPRAARGGSGEGKSE
jgi:hypothetical protein